MKKLAIIGVFAFGLVSSFAQPVFQMSDYAAVGDSFVISSTQLNLTGLDFAQTGAGFSWDYSTLVGTGQDVIRFINPDNAGYRTSWIANCIVTTGGVFACPGKWDDLTNLAVRETDDSNPGLLNLLPVGVSNIVTHYSKDNNLLRETLLGVSVGSGGLSLPFPIDYTIPDTIYRFPINYLDVDSSAKDFSLDLNPFGIDFLYSSNQKRVNTVEGWGNLITPYGTFPSALKLRTVIYHNDSLSTQGNTLPGNITTEVVYSWLDPGTGYPVLQATGLIAAGLEVITNVRFLDSVRCYDPVAFFLATPIPVIADPSSGLATVNFTNLSQNADQFAWDFGDGGFSTATNPSHDFTGAGVYQVQLIACNSICTPLRCDTVMIPVIVIDTAQIAANFFPSTPTTCVGDTVTFSNFSVNADQYLWDFGDGDTSTLEEPVHAWQTSGNFTITLIASGTGLSDTLQRTITVNAVPVASAGNDTSLNPGQNVQLSASGGGNNAIYAWNFDATLSCLLCANPIATPSQTTLYVVSVQNNCGFSTDTVRVTVSGTGIEAEHLISRTFKVFPNPAEDHITIERTADVPSRSAYVWLLYDADGRMIAQGRATTRKTNVPLSRYPQGLYLLQVVSKGDSGFFRVVKR
ncbi:MAG: PKD domain-containing protein [Bacteroidia bacterium]|nr:PKD domain-containing protein [Bacteroidia bacterium]